MALTFDVNEVKKMLDDQQKRLNDPDRFDPVKWEDAPVDATHAWRTLHGRPWIFEKHIDGEIYQFNSASEWIYHRPCDEAAMSNRRVRPISNGA